MNRVPLDFENAVKLDNGTVNVLLKQQLKRVANDVMDRPADPTKREVTLTFKVEPILKPNGECDHVKVVVECAAKTPKYRTPEYEMLVTTGGFKFNAEDADSVDQHTMFEKEDE